MVSIWRQINENVAIFDRNPHELGIQMSVTPATLTAPEAIHLITEIAEWLDRRWEPSDEIED